MSISKKIRFEVFKRDGFCCSYCGKTPPDALLEIDHIKPSSKGGGDDLCNLITACFDCNRGKSNIELTKIPSKMSENLEVLQEKESQIKAYQRFVKKINKRITREIKEIEECFSSFFNGVVFVDTFKNVSLKRFLSKLPVHVLKDCMAYSCVRMKEPEAAVKYFCGICWNKIREQ